MKWKIVAAVGGIFSAVLIGWGETVTADSGPFTFPQTIGIKGGTYKVPAVFIKTSYSLTAKTVSFKWSFPAQSTSRSGAIVIYSLRGQVIKSLPVTVSSGIVKWNAAEDGARGVYIASFVYGSFKQNIKLMLYW
jgi:hypothetical protein